MPAPCDAQPTTADPGTSAGGALFAAATALAGDLRRGCRLEVATLRAAMNNRASTLAAGRSGALLFSLAGPMACWRAIGRRALRGADGFGCSLSALSAPRGRARRRPAARPGRNPAPQPSQSNSPLGPHSAALRPGRPPAAVSRRLLRRGRPGSASDRSSSRRRAGRDGRGRTRGRHHDDRELRG
jgi:hypothetical protein